MNNCIDCGKENIHHQSKRCRKCADKEHSIMMKEKNPFLGKHHDKKTKNINALAHERPIKSIRILKCHNRKQIKIKRNKWMKLSRYLVEKYIGYKLKKGWIVHHIDGNSLNDKLSNLYIFKNTGLHLCFEMLIKYKLISRFILRNNLNEYKK
jgi:DNA-directed RNA polymerase subunit RPC12/RpoP